MFTDCSIPQQFSSFEQVLEIVGERIPVKKIKGNCISYTLGYTRTLSHPALLRVTQKIPVGDIRDFFNFEDTEFEQVPVLILASREMRDLYEHLFKILYPVTDTLNRMSFLIDVMSLEEIREVLNSKCKLLSTRATKNFKEAIIQAPSGYWHNSPRDEDILEKISYFKNFEVLSSLFSANPDHPECQSLIELYNQYPKILEKKADKILLSPFCIPCILKFIPFISHQGFLESQMVTLYERSNLDSPENLFVPLTEQLCNYYLVRKLEFVQTVAHYCIGPWCNDIDYSKSSISGGIICCIIHILLSRGYTDVDIYNRYLPYNLEVLSVEPDEIPKIVFFEDQRVEVYSNFVIKIEDKVYKLSPGCDVDIGVNTDSEDEMNSIAFDHFEKISKYFPGAVLSKYGMTYKIYHTDPIKYLEGFRDVDIYPKKPRECIKYHVPMVRGYWDGENVYVSLLCLKSHFSFSMKPSDFYFNLGSESILDILKKYSKRGFDTGYPKDILYEPVNLSKRIPKFLSEEDLDTLKCKRINDESANNSIGIQSSPVKKVVEEIPVKPKRIFDIIAVSSGEETPKSVSYKYPEFI